MPPIWPSTSRANALVRPGICLHRTQTCMHKTTRHWKFEMITEDMRSQPGPENLTLDAKPSPFALSLAKSAVLVVDMQNDFGTEGGMFARAGIDISMIRTAVAPTADVVAAARRRGLPIVYLKMAFKADLSDAGAADSPNYMRHLRMGVGTRVNAPDGAESRILIRDTWNTDILRELAPMAGDIVIYKHRFSGFFETELDSILKSRGIRQLVVTGCTTSICVEATIRDAMFRDYSCVLLSDCTGEPIGHEMPRSNHDASLLNVQVLLGWVSTSADFISTLGRKQRIPEGG